MVQMIQKSEFSPKFPKSMKNKWLYRAQLRRRRNLKRKDNKWDMCWNLNTDIAWRELKRLPVQSNVKGFLWLFVNHALPVAGRSWGEADKSCPPLCPRSGRYQPLSPAL